MKTRRIILWSKWRGVIFDFAKFDFFMNMKEENELTNWQVYRNFVHRNENFWSKPKRFVQFVLIMSVNGFVFGLLSFSWIVETIISIMLCIALVVLLQIRARLFESQREMKVMFSMYAIANLILGIGLLVSLLFANQ
jgi:FtsH-binding integral membrane protein